MMPEIHVHIHGARTIDSGTSEGARKAAQTRKLHGARFHEEEAHHHEQQAYEHSNKGNREAAAAHTSAAVYHGHALRASALQGRSTRPGKAGSYEYAHELARKASERARKVSENIRGHDGSVEETMREYKHGELHSGSKGGPRVKSRKQAIAIALSQAGKSNKDKSTRDFLPG